ncbi:acyl carrier protein [Streptomyces sp. NPDC051135]|uniref:acyl carrier protein n=1 Tax=unclassified Streptomyces TaxID=2593676 RepID=UPI0034332BAB
MPGNPVTLDTDALRGLRGAARLRAFETYLCRSLAPHLHVPPAHRVSLTRPLYAQGIDSLTALALQRTLESALGIPVPSHQLLREQTVGELAAVLSTTTEREASEDTTA